MKDSWQVHLLGDKLSVSSGSGLSESKFKPGSIKVYGGNGVVGYHNEFTNNKKEMIIGRVGAHCGNIYLTEEKSWITDNALIVSFKENNVELTFWYYLLSYLKLREFAFQSAQPVITGGILNRIEVNLPPLPQQRKIAQILSTVDAVLEKTEAAIAKYQQLKQGLMHDVFTRGIDVHTGQLRPKQTEAPERYKQSPLGWIPKEWEVETILNSTYLKGRIGWQGLRADEFIEEGPFLVTGTDFVDGEVNWSKCYHVSEERYNEAKYIQLKNDDFLITKDGTIGKTAYVKNCPEKAVLNSGIFLMRCKNDSYINRYVFHLLNSSVFDKYLFKTLGGSTIIHLYQREFEKFPFPLPNKTEQGIIINKIDSLLNQIHTEQQALAKYQQLKAGLLQDLLTGRVSV